MRIRSRKCLGLSARRPKYVAARAYAGFCGLKWLAETAAGVRILRAVHILAEAVRPQLELSVQGPLDFHLNALFQGTASIVGKARDPAA